MDAVLYESRRAEFCGLFNGRIETMQPVLDRIAADLDDAVSFAGVHAVMGVVSIPAEAADPLAALRLADERKRKQAGDLRPAPRRNVYSRVTTTLHPPGHLDDAA